MSQISLFHSEMEADFEYEVILPVRVKMKINYDLRDRHPTISSAKIGNLPLPARKALLALSDRNELSLFDVKAYHRLTEHAQILYVKSSEVNKSCRTIPMPIEIFSRTIEMGKIRFPVKMETLRKFFRNKDVMLEPAVEANISFYVWEDMYQGSLDNISEEEVASHLDGAKLYRTPTGQLRVYWQATP